MRLHHVSFAASQMVELVVIFFLESNLNLVSYTPVKELGKIVRPRYQQLPLQNPGKSSPSSMVETAVVRRQLYNISLALQIVKLQPKAKVQTSVLGLGVNIVFPLSQQKEQHPPKSIIRGCT